MGKEFTFHCCADVLVDDCLEKWDIKSTNPQDAWDKAYDRVQKSSVLDSGSLGIWMDTKELAVELGNMASGNDDEWEPVMLQKELEDIKGSELYDTLEQIVCWREI